jgi:hypothetical protein
MCSGKGKVSSDQQTKKRGTTKLAVVYNGERPYIELLQMNPGAQRYAPAGMNLP